MKRKSIVRYSVSPGFRFYWIWTITRKVSFQVRYVSLTFRKDTWQAVTSVSSTITQSQLPSHFRCLLDWLDSCRRDLQNFQLSPTFLANHTKLILNLLVRFRQHTDSMIATDLRKHNIYLWFATYISRASIQHIQVGLHTTYTSRTTCVTKWWIHVRSNVEKGLENVWKIDADRKGEEKKGEERVCWKNRCIIVH